MNQPAGLIFSTKIVIMLTLALGIGLLGGACQSQGKANPGPQGQTGPTRSTLSASEVALISSASPTVKPATNTPTPTITSTPTPRPTPTPTLDLSQCNAAGCGAAARPLPTAEFNDDLLLSTEPHVRRRCPECPANPLFSKAELDDLLIADPATLAKLQSLVLSQEIYELAPGVVFIVYDNVYHVVIDLRASGYRLRNIIPESAERNTLITPSYCYTPDSLVVINADYHGLNGSNKTETGRDLFFHLGRAALFQQSGRFDLDVIRERSIYDRTTLSWGGGPIFLWYGKYDYNPEQEWFEQEDLDYYRDTYWAKVSAAITKDHKYLFLTISYGLSLKEHAENIISLGETWGMKVDRAMRFDGGESAYMAIRIGDKMVPILNLEEPLIVNCLAVEQAP